MNIVKFLLGLVIGLFFYSSVIAQDYAAMVKPKDSKAWGYINGKGEMIIPAQFSKCFPFSDNGLATIYDKEEGYYFINLEGKRLETEVKSFDLIEGGFGIGLKTFNDGLTPVRERRNKKYGIQFFPGQNKVLNATARDEDSWGYLNEAGKLAIPMKYKTVSMFSGGYAFAISHGNFYVLDKEGKETPIKGDIKEIRRFSEGLASYTDATDSVGFVDTKGQFVVKAKYISVGFFFEGLAWVKTADDKIGFINTQGEEVIKPSYLTVGSFVDGLSWVKTADDKVGFVNTQGVEVIKPQFEAAKDFDSKAGLAAVKINDVWTYINKEGTIVTLKTGSDTFHNFEQGLAKGSKNKKIGFYNNKGEWVIEPKFDGVGEINDGYIAAREGDLWGFIDMEGNWVVKPQFDSVKKMVQIKKN